jgi:hypothetical protein
MPIESNRARTLQPVAVSYEVQVLTGGRWITELVLPDRDEAEYEANRALDSNRRLLGVSVIREEVMEQSGLIVATTLLRRLRDDRMSPQQRADRRSRLRGQLTEIDGGRLHQHQPLRRPQPLRKSTPPRLIAVEPKPSWRKRYYAKAWPIAVAALILAAALSLLALRF